MSQPVRTLRAIELKPCPFCGGPANPPGRVLKAGRTVWMATCFAGCVEMWRSSKAQLVQDWNGRV